MTTLILAEDHTIFRQGLISLLDIVPDFAVIGEADNGIDAITLVKQKRPGILITDLSIPGIDGQEVVRRTKKVSPKTGIVVLSMHADEVHVIQALRNGALAYVLKSDGMEDLEHAIRCVLGGRRFLSASLQLESRSVGMAGPGNPPADPYETLTNREREILQLVAEGYRSREISERLFISLKTVDKHRANLMDKLHRHTQVELVHYAIQRGLVPAGLRLHSENDQSDA